MFVAHERVVDLPFEVAAPRLAALFPELNGWAVGALSGRSQLEIRVGPGSGQPRIAKNVRLKWSDPILDEDRWMVSFRWKATGSPGAFPRMDADLSALADGDHTVIRFRGNYEPPLGPVGGVLDRALFHRIAESTVENFLDRVTVGLDAPPEIPSPS